ncbi:MAG TPA: hypothetical protein VM347_24690, partial [Nonomuraea sp.]|nr:hypothetical protein [Nonomuraea sp.]
MPRRFFAPARLDDIAASLAELDRQGAADAMVVWRGGGRGRARTDWTQLSLPAPRVHPAAPLLWAEA